LLDKKSWLHVHDYIVVAYIRRFERPPDEEWPAGIINIPLSEVYLGAKQSSKSRNLPKAESDEAITAPSLTFLKAVAIVVVVMILS
jgi:hypothetical protein